MKKVGCLYRVSTKRQTQDNDIPVQRNACRKFIDLKKDWKLTKEYIELGISGYKLGEQERDILQTIKKDVINKEIDVFLVFMFDRIGRRDDETPFVVKWLIEQGIEVWSVNEGQRKIEDNYDRLINYITYWQAEGESEKISLRSKDTKIQLTKQGIYIGNYAPYGYKMIKSDLYSKIGKRRKEPIIYEKEAKIVRLIYKLIAEKQYGVDKVAIYLNQKGIKRRKKDIMWDSNAILEIVKNPIYKGYISFGKRKRNREGNIRINKKEWIIADKQNQKIAIVSEKVWNIVNDLISSRSKKGKRKIRLLSGYTRCGYCGDYIIPKGKDKYCYMLCKGKQKMGRCEYDKNYRVHNLEAIIMKVVKDYLDTYERHDLKEKIIEKIKKEKKIEEKVRRLNQKISYSKNRIEELKQEIVSVLTLGNNEKSKEIRQEYEKEKNNLERLKEELDKLNNEISNQNKEIRKEYIPCWSLEFENSPLEIQRHIIEKLIDKIYLYNEKIEINIKCYIVEYCKGCD